ncbi:hypothetical protein [Saccharococcus thermophilus]|jgi:hypothetical protein|uniref:DUF4467 domain-containing protein n=1 Tax=Saccharococcus thermophilus TaxID=29396 RepID=A0A846MG21_9BACL|nr:hypothetical protein [Saccharococcus thermophilus]NIK14939.1 hypothetical protein [Saccharococcus thermophilus]
MRFKPLVVLILSLSFLSACKDDYEKTKSIQKEKYDSAINQVIELENERLKSENKPEIKRNETGIVVYNKGELIWLLYYVDSKEVTATYQKENNKYVLLPAKEASDKIDEANEEYIENLGKK